MAFRVKNANYNALRKLNLRERLAAANDTSMGQTLIQILSPTQISDLFPRYWIERNPNISGFLKAIPSSMSAAKQRAYEEQIQNTASGAAAGANYDAGGYRKKWQKEMDDERQRSQVTKRFEAPLPQLSPEQKQAFEALKAGDIGVDDDRVKFLKNIPDVDLTRAGLTRIKDDKGSRYHYQPPQVSEEDVKRSMAVGGGKRYTNAQAAALIRSVGGTPEEAAFLGAVVLQESRGGDPRAHNDKGRDNSYGLWQVNMLGSLGAARMKQFGLKSYDDLYDPVINAKAALSIYREQGKKAWGAYGDLLAGKSVYGSWEKNYQAAMEGALGKVPPPPGADPITQNYTPQQLEAKKRELQSQMEAGRLGELASMTQPGGPVNAAGAVKYDGAMPDVKVDYEKSMSRCGIGVRHIAEQMYGSKYFQGGLGGPASTLSKGSSYLTDSGFFKHGRGASIEQLRDQSYLNSLPVGTVISAAGGNERGEGHVQIKIGPNSWASDFPQGNRVLTSRRDGREYHGYTIHEPTKDGLDRLNQMGFKQTVSDSDTQHLATSAAAASAATPREYDGPKITDVETTSAKKDFGLKINDLSGNMGFNFGDLAERKAFIIHHTGGRGDVNGVMNTFKERGFPAHYVIDRDGNVFRTLPEGSQGRHIRDSAGRSGTKLGASLGLNNSNTQGVEIIAKDDSDITDVQKRAASQLAAKLGYNKNNIYGHGEVNAHKQETEGATVVRSIRSGDMDDIFAPRETGTAKSDVKSTDIIKPLSSVTQPEGPINAAGPAAPVKQTTAPTAAVEAPKAPAQPAGPTPERYNVNVNKFTDAIRQTEDFKRQAGMFGSMVPNSTIIGGFNDDPRVKAAGVRLDDKGVMHFSKGMTPDVKEVMSTFDTKSFMTKIEEKKKEDVAPTKVKAMADGGKVPVNTEQITAYPIGGLRGDNAVVVNAHQKPLFTMNTNEDVLMDPDNNRAQVIPNKKGTNVGPMPRQNMSSGIMEDFNSTIQEIRKDFANLKADKATKPDLTPTYPTVVENGWLNKLNHTADDPFKSPSARRVAYRAGGMETGEPHSGFHHSRGNNS